MQTVYTLPVFQLKPIPCLMFCWSTGAPVFVHSYCLGEPEKLKWSKLNQKFKKSFTLINLDLNIFLTFFLECEQRRLKNKLKKIGLNSHFSTTIFLPETSQTIIRYPEQFPPLYCWDYQKKLQ